MEMTYHTMENGTVVSCLSRCEFDRSYDVVVCGVGTAGSFAALCAAKQGLRVLGIDRLTGMGGIGTYGVVWDYFFGSPGGFFEEVTREARSLLRHAFVPAEPRDGRLGNRCIPGCAKEAALEHCGDRVGLETMLEATVIGVYLTGERVVGVRVAQSGKITDIGACYVIDCTGNSLVCRMAGVAASTGRAADGRRSLFSKAVGILSEGCTRFTWGLYPDTMDNAVDYSRAALTVSSSAPALQKSYHAGNRLIYDSTILGRREGYQVDTLERLCFEDYANGAETDQPLFYVFTPLDNTNPDLALETDAHRDWATVARMRGCGFTLAVPAGVFIPKNAAGREVPGLLCCGKTMGVDHDLSTGFRMKKDFEKSGEAVAALAGLSIAYGCPASKVPYGKLREQLEATGCFDPANKVGIGSTTFADNRHEEIVLPTLAELETGFALSANESGRAYALWAARLHRNDTQWRERVRGLLDSENPQVRHSAALCCGMLGIADGAPLLLAYLQDENCTKPDAYAAIDLLGRLGYEPAVPYLADLLQNAAKASALWEQADTAVEEQRVYHLTAFVLCALLKIGGKQAQTAIRAWIASADGRFAPLAEYAGSRLVCDA